MWGRIWSGVFMGLTRVLMASADPQEPGFVDRFKSLETADWHVAHYDFDHPAFDTDWRKAQVLFGDGLSLQLSPKPGTRQGPADNGFLGGSVRRLLPSHFGRYEVILQAARGEGLVTGFFIYTGPTYGTRHDEIDIEFLGKDTTKMHVAWFVGGNLTSKFIDLKFDAAERPHVYAFEWASDRIRWFVDDRLVFEHHVRDGPVPQVPGRLFANLWRLITGSRSGQVKRTPQRRPRRLYDAWRICRTITPVIRAVLYLNKSCSIYPKQTLAEPISSAKWGSLLRTKADLVERHHAS